MKDVFANIDKIEIFNDDDLVATYTTYDSFENISYSGNNELLVTLKQVNLIEQVKQLKQKIDPVVNLDAMIIEERRKYEIEKIRKAVQEDIFNGIDVDLSNGNTEHFDLTLEDQANLSSLYLTSITSHGLITSLPYHSKGNLCREYPVEDIIRIYVAMQKFIALKTTVANFTIQRALKVVDANDFADVYYGMTFGTEETSQINEIMLSTEATIDAMLELLNDGESDGD